MDTIEKELSAIHERNLRVEADKAWETSMFRKILLALITYGVAALVLYSIGVPDFYKGAIIPAVGFLLSTLSLPWVKKWWIKSHFEREKK